MCVKTMKIWAICFSILAFAAISLKAQVCTPAPVGLVSWWAADGNALDSRSRSNGTLQNGAALGAGQNGQAFNLDGNNDFVEVADLPTLDVQQFTIEVWVYPTSNTSGGANDSLSFIIAKESSTSNQYTIGRKNNTVCGSGMGIPTGNFAFYIEGLTGLPNDCSAFVNGNAFLPLNTWSHVALTYDGANVRAFVNGNLSRIVAATGTIPDTTGSFQIGGRIRGGTSFWAGQIDESTIYNRALSATEIAAIANAGTAGKCKPTATVAPSGQVGWWAGDGNPTDISGNGNNGTLQNGAGFAVGKIGQGFSFDRNSIQFVDIPDSVSTSITGEITLEAWINPINNQEVQVIISKYDSVVSPAQQSYFLGTVNGFVRFVVYPSQDLTYRGVDSPVAIQTNTFTHIVATFNPATQETKIYQNGVDTNASLIGGSVNVPSIFDSSTAVRIGAVVNSSGGNTPFNGKIDEPSIYNRILTDAEITSIFNAGIAGKLKETTTTGTTAIIGDATVTYAGAATRRTQEISLLAGLFPALPAGMHTGLIYDIAADLSLANPMVCFNLPSFTPAQFTNLRIFHLEANQWQPRTAASNTYPTLCTAGLSSLSPFAIAQLPPTAANVSIGGRVRSANGKGITRAQVSLTDSNGETSHTQTNLFGAYRFDNVRVGETYVISVDHRFLQFTPNPQMHFISENDLKIDFVAQ